MLEVRGVPQGMGLFYIHVSVDVTEDGYEGSQKFPTFFTVGGNEADAVRNARTILGLVPGDVLRSGAMVVAVKLSADRVDS